MKKIIYVIICVSAITMLFANSQIIESFRATTNDDVVNIEWKTITEKNISMFEVQRLSNGIFKTIYSKTAIGKPSTYKFTDSDSFTKEANTIQATNVETYRIKIIYSDTSPATYTDEAQAVRSVSSIKRTLGMLKEMFK
jgi:hypothetical protein